MSPALKKLAAQMLSDASDEYSNHGCNDWQWPADLSAEDRRALSDAVNAQSHADDRRDHTTNRKFGPPDWCVMIALSELLEAEAEARSVKP